MRLRDIKCRHAFFLLVIFIGTQGQECEPPRPEQFVDYPSDGCPNWDDDCDRISDAVENEPANSYLNLDPSARNDNPSIARGTPTNGSIDNALNMVNSGPGYWHYNPEKTNTDDWSVLHLINMIERAGREWWSEHFTPPRISVGDLSFGDASTQNFGGLFLPHTSHQNGLDADFRYVRRDNEEEPLNIRSQSSQYDQIATSALINAIFRSGDVTLVITSPYDMIIWQDWVPMQYDYSGNHDNHFHIRIADPDGTDN